MKKIHVNHIKVICVFCALALVLHGNSRLEEDTFKTLNLLMSRMDRQFHGVHKNDIPIVEDLLLLNFLLYDIHIVEGNRIGELVRRSVQKHEHFVRLLRYNNHICFVSNFNAVFQSFRCPNCDIFFNRTSNLERHLTICSERVKNVYPKNVYQTQETLFDTLDSFAIEYTNDQTLLKNLDIYDLESCKKKSPTTLIEQIGLKSKFPSCFPFPQILWKSQFAFATLILIILLLFLSVLLKI